MNSTFLFALTANGNSFGENAATAGTVTLVGMVAIFIVLALLWGLIEVMHTLLTPAAQKAAEKKQKPAPAPKQAKAPASVIAPAPAAAPAANGELIAVITAAVAAAMADEGYSGGFRVVSFKRASVRKHGRS